VAAALIIAFACEQKESVTMEKPVETTATLSISDEGKIQISGPKETIEKLKSLTSDTGIDIQIDSVGNAFMVKKAPDKVQDINGEEVFFIVEEMPEFPGGDIALREFIAKSVNYPDAAAKSGKQGKVYVTFVVTKDGSVANATIARGVDPSLDAEAMRVVNSLPKWKPGKQRGKAVNVSYTVPINFKLE
jgi:TonB family protein